MSSEPANMAVARRPPAEKLQVARTPANGSSNPVVSKSKTSTPKKAQAAAVPTQETSLALTIWSKAPPAEKDIQVIGVPAKRSLQPLIFEIPSYEIDLKTAPDIFTTKLEQRLKHVPNIKGYRGPFRWESRLLYKTNITMLEGAMKYDPGDWNGTYLVYKCIKSEPDLPANEHFEHLNYGDGHGVYGDMFVFKVKKTRNSERAVYGTLEKTFVDSYRRGKAAKKLLDSLAAFDAEEAEEV